MKPGASLLDTFQEQVSRSHTGSLTVASTVKLDVDISSIPSILRTKVNADGSFCSGQRQQQGCREKDWRLKEHIQISSPFLCFVLLPQLISCRHFLSCLMQCWVYLMVGTCRAQVISLLQSFFSIGFFACERWPSR